MRSRSGCSAMPERITPARRCSGRRSIFLIVLGTGLNERDTMHWALQLAPSAAISVNLSAASLGMHAQDGGVVDCGAYLKFCWSGAMCSRIARRNSHARVQWISNIRSKPRLQDPGELRE